MKKGRARSSFLTDIAGRKTSLLLIFFFLLTAPIFAIQFADLNLSDDNRLIYRASFGNQNTVYVSHLAGGTGFGLSMQQLTAFPERMHLVNNGRTLIAVNRFGAVSIPVMGGLPSPLPGFPSFTEGHLPQQGRLEEIAVSPDGRWLLFIDPISAGFGNLILVDITSGAAQIVSERIELPASGFPASWSPDSRFFVYAKGGRLFFFPAGSTHPTVVDERFRMIGYGGINSILWRPQGYFFYLTGNTLYRITNPELFTRTLFGDFLSAGDAAAILPFDFDPQFDRFWIAPDLESILINKNGKGAFLFLLGENQNNRFAEFSTALPHLTLPYGAENFNAFWAGTRAGSLLTVVYSLRGETIVWRFEIAGNSVRTIREQNTPLSAKGVLSPDGTRIAFWGERGLELWDHSQWRLIQRLSNTAVLGSVWANNAQLITGNSRFIEEINTIIPTFPRRRIALSSADEIAFEESPQFGLARGTTRILARAGTAWFATDGINAWTSVNNQQIRPVSLATDRFRVFLEQQTRGPFTNIIMMRNLQTFATTPVFSGTTGIAVNQAGRRMRIALCFDLYDDDTGLAKVLAALQRNNIRATFFLNGEFIRRNPNAARAVADAGHEAASLFHAPVDFSDVRFLITEEFVKQGLARNEDEFFHATGRELSGLWRPPFFRNSELITAAAAAAGYFTVSRSIDTRDWLSREEALRLNIRQVSPSEKIEQIMEQIYDGAIIPLRIGLLPGGRNSHLFQYIEVLLDALIRAGHEIVPVSSVILSSAVLPSGHR